MIRRVILAALVAVSAVPGIPAHAAAVPDVVRFTALTAAGLPAVNAVAVATVMSNLPDGASSRPAYTFRPTETGTFTIDIPADDPEIARSLPKQKLFNVRITVYDFVAHRRQPVAVAFVDHVLDFGDPAVPPDVAGLDGTTIRLVALPSATSPTSTPPRALTELRDRIPEYNYCTTAGIPPQPEGYYSCFYVSHPNYAANESVVVATNVGSGSEMDVELDVQNTSGVSTTTSSGIEGLIVESTGAATVSETLTESWKFFGESRPGGPAAQDAALLVDFAEVLRQDCLLDVCTEAVTWLPDRISGQEPSMLPTTGESWHDSAANPGPGNLDCTVGVQHSWSRSEGVNERVEWTFGFDYGGYARSMTLHAFMVVQEVRNADYRNGYTWSVTAHSFRHHYVFVHNGLANTSDGGRLCPINAPGQVYTDASNTYKVNPGGSQLTPVLADPPSTQEAEKRVHRCVEAPERCGREP